MYGEGGSNHRACNLVRQQRFLTKVVARLESEPAKVIAEMQAMRAVLTGELTHTIALLCVGRARVSMCVILSLRVILCLRVAGACVCVCCCCCVCVCCRWV